MSRFYIRPESVKGNKIYVDGQEAHHILDVMRLKTKDKIIAFDGTGKEYLGVIEGLSNKALVIKIEGRGEQRAAKKYKVTLAQAIPKMDKMDYIIQKLTELGTDSIIPVNTKRTIVKLRKEKLCSRRKRWERIAQEAAKQCGRSTVATIGDYSNFSAVIERAKDYDLAIMPSVLPFEKANLKKIMSEFKGKSVLVLIGPEGGFDLEEFDTAVKNGVIPVSLGQNILKCDTAAIAVVSIINYALDNL